MKKYKKNAEDNKEIQSLLLQFKNIHLNEFNPEFIQSSYLKIYTFSNNFKFS